MKSFLFLIVSVVIFSCSKDDEANVYTPPEARPSIFINETYSKVLTINEFQSLSAGDILTTIEASTNFGVLHFEIISQTIENAFSINSDTGDIIVNDIEDINSFEGVNNIVSIKISNGEVYKNTYLSIYVIPSCDTSYWELNDLQVEWISENNVTIQEFEVKTIQFTFSVSENKIMCLFSFPYYDYYNANTTGQVQLRDEDSEVLLNQLVTTTYYNDWWEAYYLESLDLEIPIIKNKEYTLIISFNQDLPLTFNIYPNNSDIPFPIEWGDLKLIETSYVDIEGGVQTNKALLPLDISLKPI